MTAAIVNEDEYRTALAELDRFFDAPPAPETPEGQSFMALIARVSAYESEHHPIPVPDPDDLPKLSAEEVRAMPEEEWEALCQRIASGDTPYLITEDGDSRDLALVPVHVLERLVRAAGALPPSQRTPEDDKWVEQFRAMRGTLADGPDLDTL